MFTKLSEESAKRKQSTRLSALEQPLEERSWLLATGSKGHFLGGSSIAAPQPIGVSSQCRDGTRGHFAEKQKHVPFISFSFPSPSLNLRCSANARIKTISPLFSCRTEVTASLKGSTKAGKIPDSKLSANSSGIFRGKVYENS